MVEGACLLKQHYQPGQNSLSDYVNRLSNRWGFISVYYAIYTYSGSHPPASGKACLSGSAAPGSSIVLALTFLVKDRGTKNGGTQGTLEAQGAVSHFVFAQDEHGWVE